MLTRWARTIARYWAFFPPDPHWYRDDAEAIRSDWYAISGDLRTAMREFEAWQGKER